MMGFNGARYFGMQRNRQAHTIENVLLDALLEAKLINDKGYDDTRNLKMQRTARTDRGVSAVRQVPSAVVLMLPFS